MKNKISLYKQILVIIIAMFLTFTNHCDAKTKKRIPGCINPANNYSAYIFDPRNIITDCIGFTDYHQATALAMAKISNMAYIKHEEDLNLIIGQINSRYKLTEEFKLYCNSYKSPTYKVNYLLIGNKHFVILAFRGTTGSP